MIGAGKLGFELASRLCQENRDVVVIDRAAGRLSEIERNLDVMAIHGNGASLRVLERAGVSGASLVIAVTDLDEVNMLACMLAKQAGAHTTIARVRDPDYDTDLALASDGTYAGVDVTINPDHQAAVDIARLIKNPDSSEFDYLAGGKVQILSYTVEPDSPVAHTRVRELDIATATLVAILRNGDVLIPRGDTDILPGDKVFVVGRRGVPSVFGWRAGREATRLRTVSIMGGSSIGYYLARAVEPLAAHGVQLKLFEKDGERCRTLAEAFPRLTVIQGDPSNLEVLQDENAEGSDAVAVVGDSDQSNLLTGYLLKRMGVPRVVVSLKRTEYLPFTGPMDLDGTVVPRVSAAAAILKIIRGDRVLSLALLKEARAEVLEVLASEDCPACGIPLRDLGVPTGAVIGVLVRGGHVIVPRGDTRILPGDHVIVFMVESSREDTARLFELR
ncbi:MAG TPA: Trk system potassium transporter TrkA [Bacillota bacterium]|nr:Trk system potassium transporter TrkA [Bacillota bacterium]HNY68156.1 Trk system potassium transporter TrkA [Bacillota bacterium]HOI37588.1 Trk system potassium transporter TrkA [Bacillota bacterium]HPU74788.1 Trk system potassium transporter TrkA [Bacillota bacterium]